MKKNKKNVRVLFVIILILQIIAIAYAISKREYYHIDEIYSHGLMHYKRAFIYENDDFINNWHNAEYFKDYLEINDNEKYDFSAVYNNQAEDVHPPIYYLLLRIACSFNINNFSIWPGTILNIILFIFSICLSSNDISFISLNESIVSTSASNASAYLEINAKVGECSILSKRDINCLLTPIISATSC